MAMHHYYIRSPMSSQWRSQNFITPSAKIFMTRDPSSDNQKDRIQEVAIPPSNQFAPPLESIFRRRLLTGIGTASVVALGANFAGITSFLLGLSPDGARSLRLDVIYPIGGYTRRFDTNEGFEFVYPSNWVGDQTLLYRAAGKLERSLNDPLWLSSNNRRKNVNEPIAAFGPPGSNGELNVSVIVAQVPIDFKIETFGGANEVGEAIVKTIVNGKRPNNVKGKLIQANLRVEDSIKYYTLEFQVESPTFQRHNVAVCCAKEGKLFTLNSQAPQSIWPMVKSDFYTIADSFRLTS